MRKGGYITKCNLALIKFCKVKTMLTIMLNTIKLSQFVDKQYFYKLKVLIKVIIIYVFDNFSSLFLRISTKSNHIQPIRTKPRLCAQFI